MANAKSKMYTLGDLIDLQRGTTYKSKLLGQPGPVLLGLASIERDGGFRSDNLKTYGGESPEKLTLIPGEIYVSLKDVTQSGDLLGAVARVPKSIDRGRLTQDTVKLIFKGNFPCRNYIYWLLRTPQYRNYCRAHAIGTTNLSISRDDFLAFPVKEPVSDQITLVNILEALESKIELNRRMNRTLEAIARTIFESWFVDFDPVHSKAEDGKLSGLSSEIASLFPDSFEDSDLGEIPRGWKTGVLEDLFILQRGFDLPEKQRIPGLYQVIAASGPSTHHNEAKVKGPGVVTGRSGVLGKVFFIQDDFWPLNTTLWVKSYKKSLPCYAYFLLKTFDLSIFNAGSAVPTLNRNHIHNLSVILPDYEVIKHFEAFAGLLFKRQKTNEEEANTLSAIRNALLPKLISGELPVPDVERIVGRCI